MNTVCAPKCAHHLSFLGQGRRRAASREVHGTFLESSIARGHRLRSRSNANSARLDRALEDAPGSAYNLSMISSRTVCAVGLVIAIASAQTGKLDRASESALIAANEELLKAIQDRNESVLRKRLADDFVLVHNSGGARESREAFIAQTLRGQNPYTVQGVYVTRYDRSVRVVGTDSAIINDNVNLRQGTRSRWVSDGTVWRRRSDTWQAVYHQGTPIGEGIIETAEDRANYPKLAGQYKTSDGRTFSVRAEERRLLMFGPRSLERQDILIPQGGLEYQVGSFGTIKFTLDGNNVSATALQNGKAVWTATRSQQ